jgi:hypothetical protein
MSAPGTDGTLTRDGGKEHAGSASKTRKIEINTGAFRRTRGRAEKRLAVIDSAIIAKRGSGKKVDQAKVSLPIGINAAPGLPWSGFVVGY